MGRSVNGIRPGQVFPSTRSEERQSADCGKAKRRKRPRQGNHCSGFGPRQASARYPPDSVSYLLTRQPRQGTTQARKEASGWPAKRLPAFLPPTF